MLPIMWLPAAIAGAAAIAGGFIGSARAKKQRKENRRIIDLNYQRYLEDFERNKPKQQMEYFREAGLNPNLIYGQTGGTAGGAPQAQPDQYEPLDLQSMAGPAISEIANVKQRKAGIAYTDAQTLKTLSEVDIKNFDLDQKKAYNKALAKASGVTAAEYLAGKEWLTNQQEYDFKTEQNEEQRKNWERTDEVAKQQISIGEAQLEKLNQSIAARKELDRLLNAVLEKGTLTESAVKSIVYFLTTKYQ